MPNFAMKTNFKDFWLHGHSTDDSLWWCEVLYHILNFINILRQYCMWYFCFIVYIERKIGDFFFHCDKNLVRHDISITVNRKLQPAAVHAYDMKMPLSYVYIYIYSHMHTGFNASKKNYLPDF